MFLILGIFFTDKNKIISFFIFIFQFVLNKKQTKKIFILFLSVYLFIRLDDIKNELSNELLNKNKINTLVG